MRKLSVLRSKIHTVDAFQSQYAGAVQCLEKAT